MKTIFTMLLFCGFGLCGFSQMRLSIPARWIVSAVGSRTPMVRATAPTLAVPAPRPAARVSLASLTLISRPLIAHSSIIRYVSVPDLALTNRLITDMGFNYFMQKKLTNYLTSTADFSLAKAYAIANAADDKLTFGFNLKFPRKDESKLRWVLNPLAEMDIKDGLATTVKDGELQKNIRLGAKATFVLYNSFSYRGMPDVEEHESNVMRKRAIAAQKVLGDLSSANASALSYPPAHFSTNLAVLVSLYTTQGIMCLYMSPANAYNNFAIAGQLIRLRIPSRLDWIEKIKEGKKEIALAEVEALKGRKSYGIARIAWLSVWGYYPLSNREYNAATTAESLLAKNPFENWEMTGQINGLMDGKLGSLYLTLAAKVYNTNTIATANKYMSEVKANAYIPIVGVGTANDSLNLAILNNEKGYIGLYDRFEAGQVSLQVVCAMPQNKTDGAEHFCTAGVSLRLEYNYSIEPVRLKGSTDRWYNAVNFRVGVPLRLKGKDAVVNVEPQLKFGDLYPFEARARGPFKNLTKLGTGTLGISVGLPFSTLYK